MHEFSVHLSDVRGVLVRDAGTLYYGTFFSVLWQKAIAQSPSTVLVRIPLVFGGSLLRIIAVNVSMKIGCQVG